MKTLKARAMARSHTTDTYLEMVLNYLLQENEPADRADTQPVPADVIYFEVETSPHLRERLTASSQKRNFNLASFAGLLVDSFFRRFESDPRDLLLIHEICSLLDEQGTVPAADFQAVVGRSRPFSGAALPPGYAARWTYARLKGLIGTVEMEDQQIAFTLQLVEKLLADIEPGEAGRR